LKIEAPGSLLLVDALYEEFRDPKGRTDQDPEGTIDRWKQGAKRLGVGILRSLVGSYVELGARLYELIFLVLVAGSIHLIGDKLAKGEEVKLHDARMIILYGSMLLFCVTVRVARYWDDAKDQLRKMESGRLAALARDIALDRGQWAFDLFLIALAASLISIGVPGLRPPGGQHDTNTTNSSPGAAGGHNGSSGPQPAGGAPAEPSKPGSQPSGDKATHEKVPGQTGNHNASKRRPHPKPAPRASLARHIEGRL
jgi:hypothetical protein